MADKVQFGHDKTGVPLYFTRTNLAGQIWNGADHVARVVADWGDYDLALAESEAGSYWYVGTFPAAADGVYDIQVYERIGAAPAVTDPLLGSARIQWKSGAEVAPSTHSAADVDALTAALLTARNLTAARMLFLNEYVSSRASPTDVAQQTAASLQSAGYTFVRAAKIDNLDATVGSRATPADVKPVVTPLSLSVSGTRFTLAGPEMRPIDVPQKYAVNLLWTLLDSGGDPVDLSEKTLRLRVLARAGVELFALESGSGITVTDAPGGQGEFTFTATHLAAAGSYQYEFLETGGPTLYGKSEFLIRPTYGPGGE